MESAIKAERRNHEGRVPCSTEHFLIILKFFPYPDSSSLRTISDAILMPMPFIEVNVSWCISTVSPLIVNMFALNKALYALSGSLRYSIGISGLKSIIDNEDIIRNGTCNNLAWAKH